MFSGGNPLASAHHADVLNAKPQGEAEIQRLVEELKRRGNASYKMGNLPEAEVLYSKSIEHNSTIAAIFGNRSMVRVGLGKFEEGLEDAQEAIKLDPTWAKGHFRAGMALKGLKKYKLSEAAFRDCLALEPNNKVASRESEVVKKLAVQAAEMEKDAAANKEAAAATANKVVKKTTTVVKSDGTTSTTTKTTTKLEADEEIGDEVRGYKVLANGKKTTYFNMERTDKEKELIGDITPKRIDETTAKKVAEDMKAPVEGGSAWNAGGTFEERDMNDWAKSRLEEILKGASVTVPAPGRDGLQAIEIRSRSLSGLEGDASITFARGKKKHIFDFEFSVNWQAIIDDDEDDGERTVEGKLFYMDFTGDADEDEEFECELRWDKRELAGKRQSEIKEYVMSMSKGLRGELNRAMLAFVQEFRAIK